MRVALTICITALFMQILGMVALENWHKRDIEYKLKYWDQLENQ